MKPRGQGPECGSSLLVIDLWHVTSCVLLLLYEVSHGNNQTGSNVPCTDNSREWNVLGIQRQFVQKRNEVGDEVESSPSSRRCAYFQAVFAS